jgi:ribosomal protein S14
MDRNIKNILKEKITLINISKRELYIKIIKSISQNNNIVNATKMYAKYQLIKSTKRCFFVSRRHKICIFTGKRGGVLKGFSFSRYFLKRLILENRLTNLKRHNW